MKVTRTTADAFTIEFESNEELLEEHRTNLSAGGLRLPTAEPPALYSNLVVTLWGAGEDVVVLKAAVVAELPDGVALMVECDPDEVLEKLLQKPAEKESQTEEPEARFENGESDDADEGAGGTGSSETERKQGTLNVLDRLRALTRMEKIILAAKADRSERAFLVQDNDPQVLLSLLKNPRLTAEEVVRIAKSSFLTYQIAELIIKTGQWMANLDVRLALIHNPKTATPFALRILPTLPESEVRVIARSGMSMPLKQAALRRLQGVG